MGTLPDEVLLRCFCALTSAASAAACAQVCRIWRDVSARHSNTIWRLLYSAHWCSRSRASVVLGAGVREDWRDQYRKRVVAEYSTRLNRVVRGMTRAGHLRPRPHGGRGDLDVVAKLASMRRVFESFKLTFFVRIDGGRPFAIRASKSKAGTHTPPSVQPHALSCSIRVPIPRAVLAGGATLCCMRTVELLVRRCSSAPPASHRVLSQAGPLDRCHRTCAPQAKSEAVGSKACVARAELCVENSVKNHVLDDLKQGPRKLSKGWQRVSSDAGAKEEDVCLYELACDPVRPPVVGADAASSVLVAGLLTDAEAERTEELGLARQCPL